MDLLALYQPRANAPLDAMARLCGLPGKLGMDGSAVHAAWLAGRIEDIRRYCETDVMNTYLLYCRYQLMRGGLTPTSTRKRWRWCAPCWPICTSRTGTSTWPRGRSTRRTDPDTRVPRTEGMSAFPRGQAADGPALACGALSVRVWSHAQPLEHRPPAART